MKHYFKWLLTLSAALSLSGQTIYAQNSREPTQSTETVTVEQSGQKLHISYQNTQSQAGEMIYHAVWSDKDGQDDLQWYSTDSGSVTVNLADHKDYGNYHIHTYVSSKGSMIALNNTSFQARQPAVTADITMPETGFIDVRLTNVPNINSEVLIPVWSETLGQDDLRWYTAVRNTDGSYQLRILLKDHDYATGPYHFHIYIRQTGTEKLQHLLSRTTQITETHMPKSSEQKPLLSIDQIDTSQGKYRVTAQETPKSKTIKAASLAVWNQEDQSDIRWYQLTTAGQERFSTEVSLRNHQALAGHYNNHVYITYTDGSQIGYIMDKADFSHFHLPAEVSVIGADKGSMTVEIRDIYQHTAFKLAVWSETGGQDDLKWYDASVVSAGYLKKLIDLRQHKDSGLYHIHVYRNGDHFSMETSTTFYVTESMLAKPVVKTTVNHQGNLYPVGQCTWGVKGLAPWASNYWGNAGQWYINAQRDGFQTGTIPQEGAIAVWPRDGLISGMTYGHVAYVTHVESDTKIQVQEANYAGKQYIGNFRGWFNPQKIWQNGRFIPSPVYYIYPNP